MSHGPRGNPGVNGLRPAVRVRETAGGASDLDVDGVDEQDRGDAVDWTVLPFGHAVRDLVGDGGDGLLGHLSPMDLGEMSGDLPVGEALTSTGPTSVSTVFARVPLRLLPLFFPAGSRF